MNVNNDQADPPVAQEQKENALATHARTRNKPVERLDFLPDNVD